MTTAVIDATTFAELQATAGAEFVDELVDTFLQEAPAMLADLRSALAGRDAEKFRRTAHSLKSNSQTFGAVALAARARDLELSGIGADAAGASQRLDELEAEYARAAQALKELRHG